MDMDIYWDDNEQLTTPQTELIKQAVKAVIESIPTSGASEVSISFMDADEIRVLNRDYRGKDTPTDVLSFPVSDEFVTGDSRPLGDIIICMEVARLQAEEYGHSLDRELAFLVVHGMLHLIGFDHETQGDEQEMCAAQDRILESMNISRQ